MELVLEHLVLVLILYYVHYVVDDDVNVFDYVIYVVDDDVNYVHYVVVDDDDVNVVDGVGRREDGQQ